jgi:hypothetical protein
MRLLVSFSILVALVFLSRCEKTRYVVCECPLYTLFSHTFLHATHHNLFHLSISLVSP